MLRDVGIMLWLIHVHTIRKGLAFGIDVSNQNWEELDIVIMSTESLA